MIPTKFEGQLYIFARQYSFDDDAFIVVTSTDLSSSDAYTLMGMTDTMTIDIPQLTAIGVDND